MPTGVILYSCVLAVATIGMWHYKSKESLQIYRDASEGMMDCVYIKFLSVELRLSIRLLQMHLNSK